MKHNFTVKRYYCKYCDTFRKKELFYNKSNIFLKDKNEKVICIECWNLYNQEV